MTRADAAAIGCCLFYAAAGSLWIGQPGVQADEVLFAQPLFDIHATASAMSVFHHQVPLMLMYYLGCLKTWLYAPLIALFGGSAAVVRLPMVMVGALTVWIAYSIVARIATPAAAVLTAVLMATDPLYLWLSRYDWGPITLQHLLTLGGVWMLLRFRDRPGQVAWLGGGFFLFGLALWDKMTFLWPAAALTMGAVLRHREVRALWTTRRAALAVACFCVGAYPWLRHNLKPPAGEAHGERQLAVQLVGGKARAFFNGLNGVALLGFLVEDRHPRPAEPQDRLGRATVALGRAAGLPRQSITGWIFLLSLAAALWMGGAARTALAMLATGFALMAITREGGRWAYHYTVLWPLPHVIIALVAATWGKAASAAVGVLCAIPALLVMNTHYAQLLLFGGAPQWTDAIYQLPQAVELAGAQTVYAVDWGILEPMQLLTVGHMPLKAGIDTREMNPGSVFVSHVDAHEILPGVNARLTADAERAGCRLRLVSTVADTRGTPMFRIQTCD